MMAHRQENPTSRVSRNAFMMTHGTLTGRQTDHIDIDASSSSSPSFCVGGSPRHPDLHSSKQEDRVKEWETTMARSKERAGRQTDHIDIDASSSSSPSFCVGGSPRHPDLHSSKQEDRVKEWETTMARSKERGEKNDREEESIFLMAR